AEKEHPDGAADAEDRVPDDGTERGDDDDRAAPDAVGKAAEDRSREERTERADALERTYPDGEAVVVRREVALHDEGHHGEDDRHADHAQHCERDEHDPGAAWGGGDHARQSNTKTRMILVLIRLS